MNDKNKFDFSNKKLIIVVVILVLLLVGGTLAATFFSVFNGNYAYKTACFDIVYDSGEDIIGTMFPSRNSLGGLNGSVTIGIDPDCGIDAKGNLYLKVDSNTSNKFIETVIPHCENKNTLESMSEYAGSDACLASTDGVWVENGTALKYAVYNNDESNKIVSVGYVNKIGDSINIYDDFKLDESTKYTVYIWLDGELADNSYSDLSFSANISATAEQVFNYIEKPVLDDGMIPVTISDDGIVTTVSEDDSSWYDYNNKKWANMVLVDEESRSTYLGTSNVTINEDDILAYYVWIPRYKYRIPGKKCSEVDSPSEELNPECYAPYTIVEEETGVNTNKELFINWFHSSAMGYDDYTIEEATEDVETVLSTGSVYIEEDYGYCTFLELLNWYNEENDTPLTYSSAFNGNTISTGPNTIDIAFETKDGQLTNGNAVTTFRTHPAFVWDGATKSGIWVGKFETSGDASIPTIKPNVQSLRSRNVSTQFTTSLKFAGGTLTDGNVTFDGSDTYGLTDNTDSHMMKNSEWGSVAYLSHSKYGINEEIYINNSKGYYTGRSAGAVGSDETVTSKGGSYNWIGQPVTGTTTYGTATDTTLGTKASTTGNVTGVYDMSGGGNEYVMGVLADSSGNPRSGYSSNDNSGFNGTIYDDGNDSSYTSGITFPQSKYYDLYNGISSMNSCNGSICYGHSLNETTNWYGDDVSFVNTGNPWFLRGDLWNVGAGAGAFSSGAFDGSANDTYSWRSVLIVDDGA